MTKKQLSTQLIEKIALYDDTAAYKELFFYYYPRLVQFSSYITADKASSEEVVSDVFLKVWKIRKSLLQIQNLQLYLYIATKNLSLNAVKKNERTKTFPLDQVSVDLRSVYLNSDERLITSETLKKIDKAIQLLPPRCKLIFKLIKEDGLSYKEVAGLLHLSTKTVDNQLSIALKKLGDSIPFRPVRSVSL